MILYKKYVDFIVIDVDLNKFCSLSILTFGNIHYNGNYVYISMFCWNRTQFVLRAPRFQQKFVKKIYYLLM